MASDLDNFKSIGGLSGLSFKKVIQKSDGKVLWQAVSTATYIVDTNVRYTEEVVIGASCLSPKTFTPSKSGWTFIGWREEGTASSSILSSKVMGSDPIVLYAVYRQQVTGTFYSGLNKANSATASGYRYYNASGNTANASITAPNVATVSGWTSLGWCNSGETSASAAEQYGNGWTISNIASNSTYYARYSQTITWTFVSYNSTQYASGTKYHNSSGNTKNASITAPTGASFSGWSWRGWSGSANADGTVDISNGQTFEAGSANIVCGMYQQTITVTYYDISNTTAKTKTGTRYINAYSGATKNHKFSITPQGFGSEWTWRGWTTTANDPNATVSYGSISNTEFSSNITLYPLIYQVICLSYNGNGATGGSVESQWAWRTYTTSGSGNTDWPASFTLAANGFSRPDYNFTGWDLGAAGATVNIWGNTTVYAQWALAAKQLYPNGVLTSWYGGSPDNGISVTTDTCPDGGADVYEDNTGYAHSLIAVDLTNYTTLTMKYRTSAYFEYNSSVSASVLFYTNPYEFLTSVSNTALIFENNNATSRTITIDVSNLNRSLYIGFHIYAICRSSGNTQSGILYIDDLKLT